MRTRQSKHLERKCSRCNQGNLFGNGEAALNAKSQFTGTIICGDCRVDEITGRYRG